MMMMMIMMITMMYVNVREFIEKNNME